MKQILCPVSAWGDCFLTEMDDAVSSFPRLEAEDFKGIFLGNLFCGMQPNDTIFLQ